MITPKRPAGFNELLPADQLALNAMVAIIRASYEQHGYTPIETPALELAQVLHAKEGGESAKQGYRFTKGDTDLALRFDLTVPFARYVAEHQHDLAFPFRRYQIQEVWRAEKPQAGRYRQFYQCDIDIIGSTSPGADADILITMHATLKALGLAEAVLHVSNRKIMADFLESRKLSKYSVELLRLVDKLDKQGGTRIKKSLIELGLKPAAADEVLALVALKGPAREITAGLKRFGLERSAGAEEIKNLASLLDAAGLKAKDYIINLGIVRGLDYYTGMVFEILLANKPQAGSVGGGGRYDNLVGHYSKTAFPGVGASIGLSRLFAALHDELDDGPASPAQGLVVVFNDALLPYCYTVAKKLRAGGLNIEVYPSAEKAGKQLGYADKAGIPFALLCGEDEEKKQSVTVKDMKSGEQKTVKLAETARYIKQSL